MTKRRIVVTAWLVLTAAVIIWLLVGNLPTEIVVLVGFLAATSLSYGMARLIALRRFAREPHPLLPRMVPLRISTVVCGIVMFGPILTSMAGWIDIVPAAASFAIGFLGILICTALFSDGYQGFWADSLIFRGRLNPPEDDYLEIRDAHRRQGK